jgi:2-methylisocitrate lyase-like PEP mutase family enzyme
MHNEAAPAVGSDPRIATAPHADTEQQRQAEHFRSLHVPGEPLVLFNVWDPGSARAVAAAGVAALATGSWSVANAHGFSDGEQMPLDLAIDNLRRIVAATTLPVSVDLESGYGESAAAVGGTVSRAITAGAVGCNIEDSYPADGRLRAIHEQVERIRSARQASEQAGLGFFINARTDVFLRAPRESHSEQLVLQVLDRAHAYASAGADGLFVPGLADVDLIALLVGRSPLPVNIMVGEATPPLPVLAEQGVARVSHGPGPFAFAMRALETAARAALT